MISMQSMIDNMKYDPNESDYFDADEDLMTEKEYERHQMINDPDYEPVSKVEKIVIPLAHYGIYLLVIALVVWMVLN
jgi:hypothetical protein